MYVCMYCVEAVFLYVHMYQFIKIEQLDNKNTHQYRK